MKPEAPTLPRMQPQSLDQLLKSAVVLHWDALTQSSIPGRIRIEYHVGADGAVQYLKLWNIAREYWSLICEYSPRLSWSDGPRFCNGYHSRPLARLLQSIMMNQTFSAPSVSTSNGTLEVGPPNAEDIEAARLRVTEAFPPAVASRTGKRAAEVQLLPLSS